MPPRLWRFAVMVSDMDALLRYALVRRALRDAKHWQSAAPTPYMGPAAEMIKLAGVALQARLEHDPEKWTPVFGKDHAPTISWSGMTIRRKVIPLQTARTSHGRHAAGFVPSGLTANSCDPMNVAAFVTFARTGAHGGAPNGQEHARRRSGDRRLPDPREGALCVRAVRPRQHPVHRCAL